MDAIKYSKMIDVGHFYGGLSGKSKDDFEDGNAKFITYMNVFTNPSLKITVDDKVRIEEGEKQNVVKYGDVIFTGSSETPDECGMSSVLEEHTDEPLYLNSFCFGYRFNDIQAVVPAFFKHLFRCNYVRAKIAKTANGVTRFNISKKLFGEIEIPIPNTEIQKEIADQLDAFTSVIENLETELVSRQKQYEHYRKDLLSLEINADIEQKCLSELSTISRGKRVVRRDLMESGTIPVYQNSLKPLGYSMNSNYPADTPFVISAGAAGEVGYSTVDYWGADDCFSIICGSSLDSKYAYYWLKTKEDFLKSRIRGGAIKRLSRDEVENLQIIIPSLDIQKEIVKSLDTFELLIANIKQELDARKKQYEYYREKLLTFE